MSPMPSTSPMPSREETIAVLEATDGHYGRVLDEGLQKVKAGWPTPEWSKEAARIVRALRLQRAGTMWKNQTVVCERCGAPFKAHGAPREVAQRFGIPLERRALICPPVGWEMGRRL